MKIATVILGVGLPSARAVLAVAWAGLASALVPRHPDGVTAESRRFNSRAARPRNRRSTRSCRSALPPAGGRRAQGHRAVQECQGADRRVGRRVHATAAGGHQLGFTASKAAPSATTRIGLLPPTRNQRSSIARRMFEMTRYINSAWASHVNPSGMTCYTCHRGQPVPAEVWWPRPAAPVRAIHKTGAILGMKPRTPSRPSSPTTGYAEYYLQDNPVAAQSTTAMRTHDVADVIVPTRIYEMMMQYSLSIGVNCGYCHLNTSVFEDWSQSTPMRWTGLLRLALDPRPQPQLSAAAGPGHPSAAHPGSLDGHAGHSGDHQSGQQPGNALLTCATCHYRLPQPLNGANMVKDYPGLVGTSPKAKDADPDGVLGHLRRACSRPWPKNPVENTPGTEASQTMIGVFTIPDRSCPGPDRRHRASPGSSSSGTCSARASGRAIRSRRPFRRCATASSAGLTCRRPRRICCSRAAPTRSSSGV